MLTDWLLILLAFFLVVLTGFFVAGEFSLLGLDKDELIRRRRVGVAGLGLLIRSCSRMSTNLSGAQLGITLCSLLIGYLAEAAFLGILSNLLASWPVAVRLSFSSLVALVLATLVTMLLGELIPKNLALARPVGVARVVLPVQSGFTFIFRPAIWILNVCANGILRLFGIQAREELSGARSVNEIVSLVRRSAQEGSLAPNSARMIVRSLHFAKRNVGAVMTPWSQVAKVSSTASAAKILNLSVKTGFSRFPLVDNVGESVGVVTIGRVLAVARDQRDRVLAGSLALELLRVPETMSLEGLLLSLRQGLPLAVVVDEWGDSVGLVSLEDLVEEVVGEIDDEYDPRDSDLVRLTKNQVAFSGLLRPDEVFYRAGIEIPDDGPYETVGGFLMQALARIPAVGDSVAISSGTLVIESMDGLRVDRVRYDPKNTVD